MVTKQLPLFPRLKNFQHSRNDLASCLSKRINFYLEYCRFRNWLVPLIHLKWDNLRFRVARLKTPTHGGDWQEKNSYNLKQNPYKCIFMISFFPASWQKYINPGSLNVLMILIISCKKKLFVELSGKNRLSWLANRTCLF